MHPKATAERDAPGYFQLSGFRVQINIFPVVEDFDIPVQPLGEDVFDEASRLDNSNSMAANTMSFLVIGAEPSELTAEDVRKFWRVRRRDPMCRLLLPKKFHERMRV